MDWIHGDKHRDVWIRILIFIGVYRTTWAVGLSCFLLEMAIILNEKVGLLKWFISAWGNLIVASIIYFKKIPRILCAGNYFTMAIEKVV